LRRFAAKTTVAASLIAHASCVTIDSEQETRKNSQDIVPTSAKRQENLQTFAATSISSHVRRLFGKL
jgi:hypothetical protein